ncbi:hypothetical protein ACP6PL_28430 [Dapis sp. BLCC M126]|uniref:hypothetical protein n=1 Tax=Dapis sp. BLCC M126 TaxID=3400189 RepID=UPI003CECDB0B
MNKPKKFYLPIWFPYPSSWLKALIMLSFLTILVALIRNFELGRYFWEQVGGSLELLVSLSIVILFFFIPVFAFAHHFFILLFNTIRETFSKKYRYHLFFFPTIISWWKALYSWLVIMISTLAAILVSTLIMPWINLNYTVFILEKNLFLYPESVIDKLLLFIFISIWVIVAAKLYQFEFISKSFFLSSKTNHYSQAKSSKVNQINQNQPDVDLNKIDDELAKSSIYYGVNQITKPQNIREQIHNKKLIYSQNNQLKKLPKIIRDNILVLLIIPLLGLGVYKFSQWQLASETPVVTVTEIPSPIPKKLNSEKPEVEEVKIEPTPLSSPTKKSASIPTKTIVLPPPDPFTLAVNRAINAAEMAQSAQSQIEWEAVASQWQDATELMKIVPVSHPKYKEARKKIKEYQSYADYAIRVAKIKR